MTKEAGNSKTCRAGQQAEGPGQLQFKPKGHLLAEVPLPQGPQPSSAETSTD